ncbi:recombinase family protein [Pelosinus sp. IPA-1]|uniref:recombinase family protein n=1 Tax=Pelosinus sp. IPA-1 TaxID=3029569 RepID=UPI00243620A0|nr:recombinase family protein [Pelosinus sp. IPA-1]GMB00881.1 putative DNA recombinase [Pelosinus sp. IPA-1]
MSYIPYSNERIIAIYVRVSTEEQAKSGYSLADQLRRCKEKAGCTIVNEYIDDGYSGEFMERPALDELRNDLHKGLIKTVIVYDLDRLSRETDHLLILVKEIEKRAELIFVTNEYAKTPAGELFMTIHAAMAKYEKETIKSRTMRGKRQKALSGKLVFNDKAYGYNFNNEKSMYEVNLKEAEIVRLMFNTYIDRNYGVRSLAFELKAMGITNRLGKPFTISNIHRILSNEMYAGTKWSFKYYEKKVGQYKSERTIRDQSEWIPISVPVIVDVEIWMKVQAMLKQNMNFSKRNTKREYLLRGIIRCGSCGYSMIGSRKLIKDKEYLYYTCPSKMEKRECHNGTVRADKLDSNVWTYIENWSADGHDLNNLVTINSPTDNGMITKIREQINELNESKSEILYLIRKRKITIEEADNDIDIINKELNIANDTLNKLTKVEHPKTTVTHLDILNADTFEKRRKVILSLNIYIKAIRTGWKPENIDWGFE